MALEIVAMRTVELVRCFPCSAPVSELLATLHDRGVKSMAGRTFIGGSSRGLPPEQALQPSVTMLPAAAPLTPGEKCMAVVTIRDQVRALIANAVDREPMSVDLAEATYRFEPGRGLDLRIEMHGLVDRVTHVVLS